MWFHNWFLRDFSIWLAELVSCMFNSSVKTGIFPQLWRRANVVPVPKVQIAGNIETDLKAGVSDCWSGTSSYYYYYFCFAFVPEEVKIPGVKN